MFFSTILSITKSIDAFKLKILIKAIKMTMKAKIIMHVH
jgi:hypothetical protein